MAWKDWRKEVPKVFVRAGCFDVKRRVPRQKHVLYRVEEMTVENKKTRESLPVPAHDRIAEDGFR